MKIHYGSRLVESGSTLSSEQTRAHPQWTIPSDDGGWWTLVMVDPDTTPPSFIHWMVVNMSGSRSEHVVEYEPPAHTMGVRRYAFYWLRQNGPVSISSSQDRRWFSVHAFAKKYGMTLVSRIVWWVNW